MNKNGNPFGLDLIPPIQPSEYMPKNKEGALPPQSNNKTPAKKPAYTTQAVAITDIDIPFLRIIVILLKWMLAAVPAVIVAYIIMFVVGNLLSIGALTLALIK